MSDFTKEQQATIDAVIGTVKKVDWDGDISPYIDRIAEELAGLLAQSDVFIDLVEALRQQAVQWGLVQWSESEGLRIEDISWHQLGQRLKALIPE